MRGCPNPFVPIALLVHSFDCGMICWWYGNIASIPEGFALCDGTQGTPDLRDKFVICASEDVEGVPTAMYSMERHHAAGTPTHGYPLADGDKIIVGSPGGHFAWGGSTASSYSPSKALVLIMQL